MNDSTRPSRFTSQRRRGYVLVVTLGLLVLAASLMVGVSRAAFRRVVEARLAQDELQRRWGVSSCRAAVLPYAEQILITQESQRRRAVPIYRTRVELGSQTFELVLSDEQAKANVNALLGEAGASRAENRIRES